MQEFSGMELGGCWGAPGSPPTLWALPGSVPWCGVAEGHQGQRGRAEGGNGEGLSQFQKIKVKLIGL